MAEGLDEEEEEALFSHANPTFSGFSPGRSPFFSPSSPLKEFRYVRDFLDCTDWLFVVVMIVYLFGCLLF